MPGELTLAIESTRLRLRRFGEADVEPFAAYRALPEIERYQSWPRPYTREMARALVDEMSTGPVAPPGAWFQIAIAHRDDDRLLGDIGVRRDHPDTSGVELGFSLMPSAQRQGFMREALEALFARFPSAGIEHALAVVDTRNLASIAVLEKLAFTPAEEREAEYFGETCIDRDYRRVFGTRL